LVLKISKTKNLLFLSLCTLFEKAKTILVICFITKNIYIPSFFFYIPLFITTHKTIKETKAELKRL